MESQKVKATTVITNIGQLATPLGTKAVKGKEAGNLQVIENACVVINLDTIVWVGNATAMPDIEGNKFEHKIGRAHV